MLDHHNQSVQGNRRELTLEERMFILAHEIACYGSALDEETIKYYTRPASKKNKDRLGKIINSLKN